MHLSSGEIGDVEVAALDPHVAICEQCRRAVDDQRDVRDLLGGLPDPGRAPPDIVLAIEAALREAGAARVGPTVVPLSAAPSQRGVTGAGRWAGRGPGRWLLGAAAAALLVVAAGGLLVQNLPSGGGGDSAASDAGAGAGASSVAPESGAPAPSFAARDVVVASGTAYTQADIAAQVSALLARRSAGDAYSPSRAQGLLTTGSGLTGCLRALGAGAAPLVVDLATYDGVPAAVVVLPASGGGREVWVVARTCQPGADGTLYYARLP